MDSVRDDPAGQACRAARRARPLEEPPGERGEIAFGKRVGEGTAMAVDRLSQVAVHDKLQVMMADVERALAKLDEGSYGTCDGCGEPIGRGAPRGAALGDALRGGRRPALIPPGALR